MLTKTNTYALIALVGALLLLLATVLMDPLTVAGFIAPEATVEYKNQLATGVVYLRILLILDAVLLIGAFWFYGNAMKNWYTTLPRPAAGPVTAQHNRSDGLLIFLILVLAISLRIYHANTGLWIDEYLTLVRYVRLDALYIATNFYDDNQHWLYSLLARFSITVFGESPWSLRLPAIVFGVASVFATYWVGMRIFGRDVALIAALLLTISYHHIWYSQNARGYSMLLFGTLISVAFLYRALSDNRFQDWLLYALSLVLCVTAHLTGVFVGFAHFMVALVFVIAKRAPVSVWMNMLASFVLAAWVTLHCFAVAIPQMMSFFLDSESASGTPNLHWKSLSWAISELFNNLGVPVQAGWSLLVLGSIAGLVFCAIFWRKDKLFFALATTPAIVLLVVMILLERNLWPRLLFNMAGFVVLYLVYSAFVVGKFAAARIPYVPPGVRYIPVLVLLMVFLVSTFSVYHHPKQDFQSAYQYIEQHAAQNDNVVALHMAGVIFRDNYKLDWLVPSPEDELSAYESQDSHTWVVHTLPSYIKNARPHWAATLKTEYHLARAFKGSLGDGDILVYRK